MTEFAIEMNHVVKTFGTTRALDGLDVAVRPGEIHGFLGPNGAGKSVTIRVLLGLLRSDSGRIRVLGQDPWADAVALHRRMAYVPGEVSLWPNLTGGEIIDYFCRLRGDHDRRLRTELISRFDLDPSKKASAYSKGNRQKVALVVALSAEVELLLLDEPTSGLDPLMEQTFQEVVTALADRGRTILLSSHILAEVEQLCDRVTIIRHGRSVQTGSLDEMRGTTQTTIDIETSEPIVGVGSIPGVDVIEARSPRQMTLRVDRDVLPEVMRHVAGFDVVALVSQPPSLEELFLRAYDSEPRTGADTR